MVFATAAQAEIVSNDYWQNNHNWTDDSLSVKIVAGLVEGTSDEQTQFFQSSYIRPGHFENYTAFDNVQRVMTVFPECLWDHWTSDAADEIYTYENFLKAIAKFPKFCGESNAPLGYDEAETCKREIAAFLAHSYVSSDGWTETEGGPMQLSDDDIGQFSHDFYDDADILMVEPELLSTDGYVAISSAMWRYMTKSLPNASAHDIMAGFFEPNGSDIGAGHYAGFGST